MNAFDELTPDAVDQAIELVIAKMRRQNPTLDLRQGTVLRELLVRPGGELHAAHLAELEALRTSRSLQALAERAAPPTTEELNAAAAPLGISRMPGTVAAGVLRISMDTARTYVLQPDLEFTLADGDTAYRPARTTRVGPDADADIQLRSGPGGTWYFLLPVEAVAAGAASLLQAGQQLNSPIPGWTLVVAASDFTGGADPETVFQMIARIPAAISHRTLSSEASAEGMLRQYYPAVREVRGQGYGDPAQLRNRENPLGISAGAAVDYYVRDFSNPVLQVEELEAVRGANGYTVQIPATVATGFMRVLSVTDPTRLTPTGPTEFDPEHPCAVIDMHQGSYDFRTVRYATSPEPQGPVLPADLPQAAMNSAYQRATLLLVDPPDRGNRFTVLVTFLVAPGLPDYQRLVNSREHRFLAANVLIRAPHAGLVSVYAPVVLETDAPANTLDAVRLAVFRYINQLGFTRTLSESELMRVIHAVPGVRAVRTGHQGFRVEVEFENWGGERLAPAGGSVHLTHPRLTAHGILPETSALVALLNRIRVEASNE